MNAPEPTGRSWPCAYMRFEDGPVLSVSRRGEQIFAGCLHDGEPTTLTEFTLDELSEFIEALRLLQEPPADEAIFYEIRTLIRLTDQDGTPADRFAAADVNLRALNDAGHVAATVQRGKYHPASTTRQPSPDGTGGEGT